MSPLFLPRSRTRGWQSQSAELHLDTATQLGRSCPCPDTPGVLQNFPGQGLSEYHGVLNAPSSQRTLRCGESPAGSDSSQSIPASQRPSLQKKGEIVHQATCTKHEHKDLQQRQQSSSSGEKIRIPSDVGAQRHEEQMVQELQLSQR